MKFDESTAKSAILELLHCGKIYLRTDNKAVVAPGEG